MKATIARGLVALALIWFSLLIYDMFHEPGMLQLKKFAVEHGWQEDELATLTARSTKKIRGLLAKSTAEGRFQSMRNAKPGVVFLKIERSSPFSAWKEVEYRFEKGK